MKKTLFLFALICSFASGYLLAQSSDTFERKYQIIPPAIEPSGFGNIIAGVDFDGDGKKEIYAVNENWNDTPDELIPRIYKYELNGTSWDLVWSAVMPIPMQNSWPALANGDIDGDGKQELVWGPVNFLDAAKNPNPIRVIVFKSKGDGSDVMGVADGTGNYKPNASFTITTAANDNQRPFKWVCADVDNDGKDEIIYSGRAGYAFGILGVDKVPADGDGSEKWTVKYKYTGAVSHEVVVLGKIIYQIADDGTILATSYDGANWNTSKSASGLIPSGSWKSASVVDIDKDGKKEIVAGSAKAGASKVFLIQIANDTVYTVTEIADLALGTGGVLRGGDYGDLDNDGKVDFVFGSKAASENAAISRVKYKGGAITDKNSYEVSVIDKLALAAGGEWDIVKTANFDGDPNSEVIYGSHISRGPLTVLDMKEYVPETIAWEKTSAKAAVPAYFGSNTERGMAVGKVGGNLRMYVVSRNGGPKVIIHNALNGDSLGILINPKTTVGLFPLNCAGVSEDGIIYVCNMTTDAKAAAFTVYRWDNESDTGRAVVSYTPADASIRMGDMFTVSGQGNNTVIWAGISGQNKVVKFTTADNAKTFTPNIITLTGAVVSTTPNVSPAPDGSFYFKSYTKPVVHYKADGTPLDSVSAALVSSSATKIRYFELNGKKFIAAYVPFAGQTGPSEKVQIFNITNPNKHFLADESPSLGKVSNTNGTGSIEYIPYSYNGKNSSVFFIMGSNNGIAAYTLNPENVPMPDAINWEKSAAKTKVPAYFGSNTERAMALGKVNGEYKLFVVSRNGGPKIVVHDAVSGDSLYTISKPAVDVGYFPLNSAGVSEDGDLYVANMTLDASTGAFTVYRWNSSDTAKAVISYKAPAAGWRMGDAFNVYGKTSDNSITIWAGVANQGKLVKFTTSDNGKTFTSKEITLEGTSFGTLPNVALLKDGSFYFKNYSKPAIYYSADGKMLDTIRASNSSATNIKYFEMNNRKYLACYLPSAGQAGVAENIQIVDVTAPAKSFLYAASPSLGAVSNGNGTGTVEVMKYNQNGNDVVVLYLLGSNNGLGAFTYTSSMVLAANDTLFYGTSKNVLKNPFKEGGYIAGTNGYGDLGKAQRFEMFKDDEVNAVKYYFGFKKIVGTPDTLNLTIRSNVSGKPGAVLAAIKTTTDKLDTTGAGNVFLLDSPLKVPASGAVFVGAEWTAASNDTIALISDKNGEGDKKSRAWELYSDGSWGYFDQPGSLSWNLDADLWIAVFYKKGPQITAVSGSTVQPEAYCLSQNYPNPFNPATTIKFSLKVGGKVSLKIYNILGMEVANLVDREMNAGSQMVRFDGSKLASGVYIYSLRIEGADGSKFNSVKKMMLLK